MDPTRLFNANIRVEYGGQSEGKQRSSGERQSRSIRRLTTTKTGLKVECALDTRGYEKGVKVSDAEMASLDITGDEFHPEWNYTLKPRITSKA